jgi:hypothetical protein
MGKPLGAQQIAGAADLKTAATCRGTASQLALYVTGNDGTTSRADRCDTARRRRAIRDNIAGANYLRSAYLSRYRRAQQSLQSMKVGIWPAKQQ